MIADGVLDEAPKMDAITAITTWAAGEGGHRGLPPRSGDGFGRRLDLTIKVAPAMARIRTWDRCTCAGAYFVRPVQTVISREGGCRFPRRGCLSANSKAAPR